jgi:hypothetical protein
MIIANAFSISMIELPADVSFSRIRIERIREMISDSSTKQLARKLIEELGIHADLDEDQTYVYVKGNNYAHWYDSDDRAYQTQQLKDIGLPATEECLDAVETAIYGDAEVLQLESAIGHADTARIVSGMLGVELPANGQSVKLARGEKMIVAQYTGPRLPEGATALPAGAEIEFVLVRAK